MWIMGSLILGCVVGGLEGLEVWRPGDLEALDSLDAWRPWRPWWSGGLKNWRPWRPGGLDATVAWRPWIPWRPGGLGFLGGLVAWRSGAWRPCRPGGLGAMEAVKIIPTINAKIM